jgi:LacI family transcriptional regulator
MSDRPIVSQEVTIRDVAEAAGVSISLVSFVLNARRGPGGEYLCSASQKTAERIVETAERLGYHRNKAASSLRTGRNDTIGVIVSDISNTCFGQICRKIEKLATELGYLTLFASTDDRKESFRQLVDKFLYSGVDGFIIAPCNGVEDSIAKILKRRLPVVLFDRDLPGMEGVGRVLLDNEKAGRCAVRLLTRQGCRHIGLVRYETDIPTLIAREAGCRLEAQQDGIPFTSAILARETMRRDMVSVLHNAREEGVDAIIFPSNAITIDGISAINELGFDVPGDFAVVGFDQEDRSEIFTPGYSFVNQPTKLVAEYSFRMLSSAIRDNGALETRIINPLYTLGSRLK